MKKGTIAVEDGLTNVQQELGTEGYEITGLDRDSLQNVDAVVISGGDKDFLNMEDIATEAPVIDARGLTAAQIRNELQERIER